MVTDIQRLEEWKKLREEGKSFQYIADMYKVSRQRVHNALSKTDSFESKTKHSDLHQEWEVLFKHGMSVKAIAEKTGAPYQTVNYYLKNRKKNKSAE